MYIERDVFNQNVIDLDSVVKLVKVILLCTCVYSIFTPRVILVYQELLTIEEYMCSPNAI
jgi:hypothetical protein